MPLKNPKAIPKIPKTRKKKAEAAINAIPEKKPDRLEYYCKASFQYDNEIMQQYSVLTLETVAEFTTFSYEIVVDVLHEKRDIYIVLMGLKANPNIVPEVEPAIKELLFEDLVGDYTVHLVKQDGAINSAVFGFNLYTKKIIMKKEFMQEKENNRLFCKFDVDEESFTFEN